MLFILIDLFMTGDSFQSKEIALKIFELGLKVRKDKLNVSSFLSIMKIDNIHFRFLSVNCLNY